MTYGIGGHIPDMTYGNRNPLPQSEADKAAELLATEAGRKAIREALDEEAVAYRLALYRGARTPHKTDEWLAKFVLNEAVGVEDVNGQIIDSARKLDNEQE